MKFDVKLPENISTDLAYACGFIVGDGHLCLRKEKCEYHIVCTGNLRDEKEFYEKVIIPLLRDLFGVEFKIKISKIDNTINVIYYSKVLLQFLSNTIGIPTGSKCEKISVPPIFQKSDSLFKSFLQGYADADFCLCLKKRYSEVNYYPVICGVSRSSRIISEISEFLKKLGFQFYLEINKPKFDKRLGKSVIMSTVTLYGHRNLAKWVNEIGFRNTKTLKTIELWRERNSANAHAKKAIESIAGVGFEPTTF